MTPEELLKTANAQFAGLKRKIEANLINWQRLPSPEGSVCYQGLGEGYIVTVMKAPIIDKGMVIDGMMAELTGKFTAIHFTPEMSTFCFEAAEKAQVRG